MLLSGDVHPPAWRKENVKTVDFKIGNGEVYNLHAWANNGGGSNYFITFRPMALPLSRTPRKYSVRLSGQEIPIFDTAPDLTPDNIKVIVNGQELEFISLQKFFETVTKNDGLPHYLVQVLRKGSSTFGKQTVVVEYDTEVEIDGKKTRVCSMGLFQFYLNFYGLSEYF